MTDRTVLAVFLCVSLFFIVFDLFSFICGLLLIYELFYSMKHLKVATVFERGYINKTEFDLN